MKLKPGDRVKFLNDVGEGILVRFLDERMAEVEIEDGFRVPVLLSELIRAGAEEMVLEDEGEEQEPKAEEQTPKLEEENSVNSLPGPLQGAVFPPRVFLALVEESPDNISICLVNDSPFYLYYTLSAAEGDYFMRLHDGKLEPETKVVAAVKNLMFFEDHPLIVGQVLLFHPQALIPATSPLEVSCDTNGLHSQFDQVPSENEYFSQKAMIRSFGKPEGKSKPVTLTLDELKERLGAETPATAVSSSGQKTAPGTIPEIDLHIELLVDDPAKLNPAEILDIQLGRFRNTLEEGITRKTAKMVFIHGIGNGKLKHEIRRIMDSEYPKLRYQDASFREYGYGATLVIIPAK
jgi:hypothetical protein